MSYRVQFTPITAKKFTATVAPRALRQMLSRDLADEAENVIKRLQKYPGEEEVGGSVKHFRKTGELKLPSFRRLGVDVRTSRIGVVTISHKVQDPFTTRHEYIRTGLLGLSWDYQVKDNVGGSITLVFTNTAHDRPGNYYAGWVHGLNQPGANAVYHQTDFHAAHGWVSFADALGGMDIRDAAQDTINDYFAELGIKL